MPKTIYDSETLKEGQQVITAAAFIHHEFEGVHKVFMAKRAEMKKFLPGIFELPGGHIDFGEDIIKGLKREVMEEHGVRISVGDPIAVFTYINEIKKSHSIQVTYFAELLDPLEKIVIHPEDHSEYRWVSQKEAPNYKPKNDPELESIMKGFSVLDGNALKF